MFVFFIYMSIFYRGYKRALFMSFIQACQKNVFDNVDKNSLSFVKVGDIINLSAMYSGDRFFFLSKWSKLYAMSKM